MQLGRRSTDPPQLSQSAELRILRARTASNSVKRGAQVGTPLSIVTAYAAFRLASKFSIPLEIAGIGVGLVVQGVSSAVSYFARGGRKGEAE